MSLFDGVELSQLFDNESEYGERSRFGELTEAVIQRAEAKMGYKLSPAYRELLNYRNSFGEGYSKTYLKTIHNQLSAILNHAVNLYGLRSNAARRAGNMGKEETGEMRFWTQEEYETFV